MKVASRLVPLVDSSGCHSISAMTRSESGSEIFPVDSKGCVRVSRERREQLLNEFDESGLCPDGGVKYQTFVSVTRGAS